MEGSVIGTRPCTVGSACVGKAAWAMTPGFSGCPAHYSSAFVIKSVRKEKEKKEGEERKKARKGEKEERERTG